MVKTERFSKKVKEIDFFLKKKMDEESKLEGKKEKDEFHFKALQAVGGMFIELAHISYEDGIINKKKLENIIKEHKEAERLWKKRDKLNAEIDAAFEKLSQKRKKSIEKENEA